MKPGIPTSIPFNKSKLQKMLLGCLAFVLGASIMLVNIFSRNAAGPAPILDIFFCVVGILFFGACALVVIFKVRDITPALILDDTGIVDNASGVSAGHILWHEVVEFVITGKGNTGFLIIMVNDPTEFLERQTNPLKRMTMAANLKICGSPITIPLNVLKCDPDNLEKLLKQALDIYVGKEQILSSN